MKKTIPEFNIRFARKEDMEAIRGLVVKLAIFEKEPEAVTASIDDYYRSFEDGLIHMLVAVIMDKIVGMTLFYDTFSTWKGKMLYLEDFVIDEAYRGQGIGDKLFKETLRAAKDRGCVMMKWQVLDWNTRATKFYLNHGATIEKEWWNGKIIF